jgi:arylsulfatase A-like enzyme
MKWCMVLLGLVWTTAAFGQGVEEAGAAAGGAGKRVLIVSFDGLRPDVALRAEMPNLRGLMNGGSFTFWAETTDVAITLPSHTSMLTGQTPEKHGIHWNSEEAGKPAPQPQFPQVPTLFQLAKKRGMTTAVVAGKAKFHVFDAQGVLDWKLIKENSDDDVSDAAAGIIRAHQPEVMFVHFPDVDRVGHDRGWGTPEQVDACGVADKAFGRVLAALKEEGLLEKTLIIVSADHGGNGKTHGGLDPRSRHIPWIAAGPGVKKNFDLTRDQKLVVRTYDTFATACDFLGIETPSGIEGKAVKQAFGEGKVVSGVGK